MAESTAQLAADWIWDAWQRGEVLDDLPPELKPKTRAEGYAAQDCLARAPSERLAGWKIAATSAAGQSHIGVDGPIAGRVFDNRVVKPGATLSIKNNRMRVCEPEFAFRLGEDLSVRDTPYSVDEVLARVSDLHLALELPDSRFKDFAAVGGPTLIADNACAHDLVVGPPVTADWRALDLSKHAVTGHVAGRIERDGSGANVLGDPRIALTWLVNELSAIDHVLSAGLIVTTGTTMVPLEIVEGDDVMADFGDLGQVQVHIGV
ncbi:MAG: 2-keto-4-pentenoate hydratase [Hyphomicrobiaceae bacterium]